MKNLTRVQILGEAARLVSTDREDDYGDPHRLHANIAMAWTGALRQGGLLKEGASLDAHDVLLCMSLLKIVRESGISKHDNMIDAAGYCALAGECA